MHFLKMHSSNVADKRESIAFVTLAQPEARAEAVMRFIGSRLMLVSSQKLNWSICRAQLDKSEAKLALMMWVGERPMSTPSGDPIWEGIADGRDEAFADLVDRYGTVLFRVAWAILRCREDAEDAVQDVFVGVARARGHLERVENWRAYLLAALRRAAGKVALARKASRVHLGDLNQVPVRETKAVDADRSLQLERALGTLPAEQRELIALKVDAGLTFAEIARLLGISANTAASRYRYALEKLRVTIQG